MNINSNGKSRVKCFKSTYVLAVLMAFFVSLPTSAALYFVSDTSDTTNVTSLRGAIIAANLSGGTNIIILTNNLYALTIAGADEDASFTGDLDVTNGNLTIIGLSSSTVTITATNLGDRVLQILPAAVVSLYNLTLTGGLGVGSGSTPNLLGDIGGGILNSGTLSLSDCLITGNGIGQGESDSGLSPVEYGGGLYNSGVAEISSCIISSNYCTTLLAGPFGAGDGGGIYNAGQMTVDGSVINNNSASAGNGNFFGSGAAGGDAGGIYNASQLSLNNCTICSNNSGAGLDGTTLQGGSSGTYWVGSGGTGGDGGGIYNEGTLSMNSCTLNNNFTGGGGSGAEGYPPGRGAPGGSGGGLYNFGYAALNTCTIFGNFCGSGGSGGFASYDIFNMGPDVGGKPGNGGTGGGICNAGEVVLLACTISSNHGGPGGQGGSAQASPSYAGYPGNGTAAAGGAGGTGGLVNVTGTNLFDLLDSLVALNTGNPGGNGGQGQTTNGAYISAAAGTIGGNDLSGSFVSQGYNLIGVNGGTGFTNSYSDDLIGSAANPLNPKLGPLTNNGGVTATQNLLPDSPAIDAGDDALLYAPENLETDQRGEPRKSGTHVDIGAVEYNGLINGVVQQPLLTAVQFSASGFQFNFNGATQTGYSVLVSSNLINWAFLGSASEISPGWFSFQDSSLTNSASQFYKVSHP